MLNVRVRDKKTVSEDALVQASVEAVGRLLGGNGRILVRPSGTEPVIRVMVEAQTQTMCQDCVGQVVQTIADRGYTV